MKKVLLAICAMCISIPAFAISDQYFMAHPDLIAPTLQDCQNNPDASAEKCNAAASAQSRIQAEENARKYQANAEESKRQLLESLSSTHGPREHASPAAIQSFREVTQATTAAKIGVEACFMDKNSLAGCSGGQEGIPADVGGFLHNVAYVKTRDGHIRAAAKFNPQAGLNGETYMLTPKVVGGKLVWKVSGSCVHAGLCETTVN